MRFHRATALSLPDVARRKEPAIPTVSDARKARIKQRLGRELRSNAHSVDCYLRELQERIDDLFEYSMHDRTDWDWRLPRMPKLELSIDRWSDPESAACLSADAFARLGALYEELQAMPPSVAPWAEDWDGNECFFYAFVRRKLETYVNGIYARMADARAALESDDL